LGFLPTYLYLGAVRWRLRQRLTNSERMLADMRAMPPSAASSLAIPPAGDADRIDAAVAAEGRLL
ncbi:hypothetical protein, partial [Clostridium perfringens]